MKIHQYRNYDNYIEWQIKTNKEKKGWQYVRESTIVLIQKLQPSATHIICHGTRAGVEQQYFKSFYPNSYITGTEISDNATEYPLTIEWDFNKQKTSWVGKYDIIYSNSLDHSIDPLATLETWREQLSPVGRMYIEYSEIQSIPGGNVNDPLDATNEEIISLIQEAGMYIVDTITSDMGMRASGCVFICAKNVDRS